MTILYFIIVLGVLIFVHEFGHFIVAKRSNVLVEEFALGFGPAIIKKKIGETVYRINIFPLGGYVRMFGEEEDVDDPRCYLKQPVYKRMAIILAGPIMNMVLALVVMPIVFLIGRPEPAFFKDKPIVMEVRSSSPAALVGLMKGDKIVEVGGEDVTNWQGVMEKLKLGDKSVQLSVDRKGEAFDIVVPRGATFFGFEPELFVGDDATIDLVGEKGPAAAAGLKPKDKVVSLNGEPISGWLDLSSRIFESNGSDLKMVVQRDKQLISVVVKPLYDESAKRWLIGIQKDELKGPPMVKRRYPFFKAIKMGFADSMRVLWLTVGVLKKLVTLQMSYKVLGGPVLIAKASAAAASQGISSLLFFIALLSINLFVINLIPVPVLDGGQMMFLVIEGVIRRPLPVKFKTIANQVGFVLLILLMVLVTFNDLDRLWGIGRFWKKIF